MTSSCVLSLHALPVQMQTVPYLIDNPEVGYVQTRWVFANPDESYLTKAQEISLNFHCKCEQFVHFASGSFFNFNGTAGERALPQVTHSAVPTVLALPLSSTADMSSALLLCSLAETSVSSKAISRYQRSMW